MNTNYRMKKLILVWVLLFSAGSSFAADEQQMELKTATGTLSGTLRTPDSASPFPAALILAGSGPTDRDGNSPLLSGKNDSLKMLAAALTEAGIASLRYDKRGVGASASALVSEADLRIDHYVDDAAAWMDLLSKDSRLRGIAIIGHESILTSLESGKPWPDVPPQLNALYRPSVQPYMISWFRYAPSAEIAKLKIPVVLFQGDTDIQVSVSDAELLRAGCKKCDLQIVRGMNHIMKLVPADNARQVSSYSDPTLPLAPELVEPLVGFLVGATKRPQ